MNEIELVCFDLDDTLISQNSWYKLNVALGVTPEEDKKMYDAYMGGGMPYEDWMANLVSLYRDRGLASKEHVTAVLSDYELKSGARQLVEYLRNAGYHLALVSGSFDILVDDVANSLNIPSRKANTSIQFNSDGMLEGVVSEGDEKHAKLRHLEVFCDELDIEINQCVCIGDGANDIEMFKKTGRGITFADASEEVKAVAREVVADLRDIEKLL